MNIKKLESNLCDIVPPSTVLTNMNQ